jgi:Holliday junction resolvasome RuvABC endonuclease subunit
VIILGIDPGPEQSGLCFIEVGRNPIHPNILRAEKVLNDDLMHEMEFCTPRDYEIAIEEMVYQGRGFGQTSIDTCYFIGGLRLIAKQRNIKCELYSRRTYGQWITGGGQLNDATLRAGLESVYGRSAKKDDPLYAAPRGLRQTIGLRHRQISRACPIHAENFVNR